MALNDEADCVVVSTRHVGRDPAVSAEGRIKRPRLCRGRRRQRENGEASDEGSTGTRSSPSRWLDVGVNRDTTTTQPIQGGSLADGAGAVVRRSVPAVGEAGDLHDVAGVR